MKAVVFHEHGGTDKLIYEEAPKPELGPGEVLVKVKACALNHLDIWVREGIPAYRIKLPHISGSDVSGEVAEIAPDVKGFTVGQKVVVFPGVSCLHCPNCLAGLDNMCETYTILGAGVDGGYAEFAKVKSINVIPMPEGLTFEEAAAFPLTFLTAWHMLITRAGLKPGETALVLAAGSGIGSAAVQIAKLTGAKVIATVGDDAKVRKAKELGADEIINYTKEDFSRRAKELTGGKGVDVVFEHVGPATWEKSILSLGKTGRLVICGGTTGPSVQVDLRYIFSRQLSIFGSMMGTHREFLEVVKLVGEKRLRPVVHAKFPLKEARQAQELMLSRNYFGKIVLCPD